MQYRTFGNTGIRISRLAFGAGPVSTLMVGDDIDRQTRVIEHAINSGINWFDTAATYGAGTSESNLGRALAELGAASQVHVASKVRLSLDDLADIRSSVRRAFEKSLERLRLPKLTLLQLHNSITRNRGDEPTSITVTDVLRIGAVLDSMLELRDEGLVEHIGLTGLGDPACLAEVVRFGGFESIQTPYHLLNCTAGCAVKPFPGDADYGNIIADCASIGIGVLAIRVLAGGALAGNPPSPHTLKTPFFPLALYQRDQERARQLQQLIGHGRNLAAEAVRFTLAHSEIHSAIIGFSDTRQIDEAINALHDDAPPLDWHDVSTAQGSIWVAKN
jgi:aryl-alcohol dehydrogenase-like predicted oxidoreductase